MRDRGPRSWFCTRPVPPAARAAAVRLLYAWAAPVLIGRIEPPTGAACCCLPGSSSGAYFCSRLSISRRLFWRSRCRGSLLSVASAAPDESRSSSLDSGTVQMPSASKNRLPPAVLLRRSFLVVKLDADAEKADPSASDPSPYGWPYWWAWCECSRWPISVVSLRLYGLIVRRDLPPLPAMPDTSESSSVGSPELRSAAPYVRPFRSYRLSTIAPVELVPEDSLDERLLPSSSCSLYGVRSFALEYDLSRTMLAVVELFMSGFSSRCVCGSCCC
uniref:Uncharacterized protein n=1 Tax=Anopheles melas TaxID=34690 RepID=A0A182UFF7_9DIPT